MNENLNIIECKSDKLWDEFLLKSENKNIFSKSIFIKKSKYKSVEEVSQPSLYER